MKIKRNILSSIAMLILILIPVVAVVPAYAATNTSTNQPNFMQQLVQYIAQKFGLDQSQVQSAVNGFVVEHKETVQQNRQNREKIHLDSLVSQGIITSSQEQQILDEQSKLRGEYNPSNFKNLTSSERKAQFQKEQAEIQSWSQYTGISAKYLRPGFGWGMHMFNRWNNTAAPTPTP